MIGPEYRTCFGVQYQRSLGLVAMRYLAAWKMD